MKTGWYIKAFGALGIAVLCLGLQYSLRDQGYSTVRLFGGDFGFARLKSFTFLVWRGDLLEFPFDAVVFLLAAACTVLAMVVACRHFTLRSTNASSVT
jgi:hypothetical protein